MSGGPKTIKYTVKNGEYTVHKDKNHKYTFTKGQLDEADYIHSTLGEEAQRSIREVTAAIKKAKETIYNRYETRVASQERALKNAGIKDDDVKNILSGKTFSQGASEGMQSLKEEREKRIENLDTVMIGNTSLGDMFTKVLSDLSNGDDNMKKLSRQINKARDLFADCLADGALGKELLQSYAEQVIEEYVSNGNKDKQGSLKNSIIKDTFDKMKNATVIKMDSKKWGGTSVNTVLYKMINAIYALYEGGQSGNIDDIDEGVAKIVGGWNSTLIGAFGESINFICMIEAISPLYSELGLRLETGSETGIGSRTSELIVNYNIDEEFKKDAQFITGGIEKLKRKMTLKTDNVFSFWKGDNLVTRFDFSIKQYTDVKFDPQTGMLNSGGSISTVTSTPLLNVLVFDLYLNQNNIHNLIQLLSLSAAENDWTQAISDIKQAIILNSLVGRKVKDIESGFEDLTNTFIKINDAVVPIKRIWEELKKHPQESSVVAKISPEEIVMRRDLGRIRNWNIRIKDKDNPDKDNAYLAKLRSIMVTKVAYQVIQNQKISASLNLKDFQVY